jgi:hypothetical protein
VKAIDCPDLGQEAQLTQALVPCTPAGLRAAALHAASRPSADFITQLIAASARAPQACARRRVEPKEADTIYRAVGRSPAKPGRTLSRSL